MKLMLESKYTQISDKHPFLTYLIYGGNEYIGIIQNIDDSIATIYDYNTLTSDEQKVKFLELGDQWWFESNRLIPINIFLRSEWAMFRFALKTFNAKDVEIKFGPQLNLKEIILARRSKKRSITLIKRIP